MRDPASNIATRMNAIPPLPRALRIVALIFLFGGLNALLSMTVYALHYQLHVDLGVLGIFVFFGLRQRSAGWLTCARVLIFLNIILAFFVAVVAITKPKAHLIVLGRPVAIVPSFLLVIAALLVLALSVWAWSVLKRPEVVAVFRQPSTSSR